MSKNLKTKLRKILKKSGDIIKKVGREVSDNLNLKELETEFKDIVGINKHSFSDLMKLGQNTVISSVKIGNLELFNLKANESKEVAFDIEVLEEESLESSYDGSYNNEMLDTNNPSEQNIITNETDIGDI